MFVRERRPRKPPPAPKPNRAPQAWNAARSFGLAAKPPPPPKNPRRGVVPVPVVPVPVVPVLVVPVPVPPPGAPGGRAGNVTPCCFRHATSAARRAGLAPPPAPPPAAADAVVVVVFELLALLELLELPHAAIKPPNASAAKTRSAPRGALPMSLNLLFLS
jgi:hypothetical protein